MTTATEPAAGAPVEALRVVRGDPTPEELAAVLAVVTARAAAARAAEAEAEEQRRRAARRVSAWTDRSRTLRRAPAVGPGAWRASAW